MHVFFCKRNIYWILRYTILTNNNKKMSQILLINTKWSHDAIISWTHRIWPLHRSSCRFKSMSDAIHGKLNDTFFLLGIKKRARSEKEWDGGAKKGTEGCVITREEDLRGGGARLRLAVEQVPRAATERGSGAAEHIARGYGWSSRRSRAAASRRRRTGTPPWVPWLS